MDIFLKPLSFFGFSKNSNNKATFQEFYDWDKPTRQIQICIIMLITASLYFGFIFLEKAWVSPEVQTLMIKLHMGIVVPYLLFLSFLAYLKRYYKWLMFALTIYPIVSLSIHLYIANQLENNTIFLTEGYLGVFWIFIVSGLTFKLAMISASICSAMIIIAGSSILTQQNAYPMHIYWVFCCFSFGFFGSLVLENARKSMFLSQQKLHHLANTDVLTGIHNRAYFNKVVTNLLAKPFNQIEQHAFILIDIDKFKAINDSFGHEEGDKVIIKSAQVLLATIKKGDLLVRWGGEEFIVIANNLQSSDLFDYCENIRTQFQKSSILNSDSITVSLGATMFKSGDTQNDMLSRADKALYSAKNNGRNKVIVL